MAVLLARINANLTQDELAERSGLSRKTIGKAEAGGCLWPNTINKIAAALSVEVPQLMSRDTTHVIQIKLEGMSLSHREILMEFLRENCPGDFEIINMREGSLIVDLRASADAISEILRAFKVNSQLFFMSEWRLLYSDQDEEHYQIAYWKQLAELMLEICSLQIGSEEFTSRVASMQPLLSVGSAALGVLDQQDVYDGLLECAQRITVFAELAPIQPKRNAAS